MRWAACVLAVVAACGDSPASPRDAGAGDARSIDASTDAAPIDGPGGAATTSCLDRQNELVPRPPTAGVPCELVPPGR